MSKQEETEPENTDLSTKIDRLMENETRRFHRDMAKENMKRWEVVRKRLKEDRERQNFAQYFISSNNEIKATKSPLDTEEDNSNLANSRKVYSKLDLELEELRLDAYYNLHWGDIESFHLKEAFRSQREKVY